MDGTPILNDLVFVSPDIAFTLLDNIYLVGNPVLSLIDIASGSTSIELLILKSTISNVSKIIVLVKIV